MKIEKRTREELKRFFVKNAIPTESEFADLIDGALNQKDDGIVKLSGSPLSIEASGKAESQKKALNFYTHFSDPNPSWVLSLNPRSDPANPATAKPGFSISDAAGNSRLFINESNGNVGIGTVNPIQNLDVNGRMHLNNGVIQRGGPRITTTHDLGLYSQVPGHWIRIVSNAAPIRFFTDNGVGTAITLSIEPDGRISIPGTLDFGMQARQMINLWSTTHGIGIQNSTTYFRTTTNFAWYKGGVHNDGPLNAGGGTVQMVIKDGNVGIGTATPGAKLDIVANTATAGGWYEALRFSQGAHSAITHPAGGLLFGLHGNRNFYFADIKGGTFRKYVMQINAESGNVGIGTTSPGAKLDVNGDIRTNVALISDNAHGAAYAAFSHRNQGTAGGYALLQHSEGETFLNAPAGKNINFRINNATKMSLHSNGSVSINSLASLNVADSFSANIRCADFRIGHSARKGSLGRALVDGGAVLYINYGPDWPGGVRYFGSIAKVSSRKFKEKIVALSSKEAFDAMKNLNPVKFNLKRDTDKRVHVGFIAEDVPRLVATEDKAAVNNDHILALLTRVVKDQQTAILSLRGEVDRLNGKPAFS